MFVYVFVYVFEAQNSVKSEIVRQSLHEHKEKSTLSLNS